ncbi:hypothetical protein BH160DRAFT_2782 [Burkholderia sp. H160]|nr:hypothetical protein BH160DRAFT_2782 [Burkholderia sp. H160]
MALDMFDAGWGGLRYVRRSGALRLFVTALVRDARYRRARKVVQWKVILQLVERYLEGNTAS